MNNKFILLFCHYFVGYLGKVGVDGVTPYNMEKDCKLTFWRLLIANVLPINSITNFLSMNVKLKMQVVFACSNKIVINN